VTVRLRGMLSADLPAVLGLERELFPEDAWTPRMFASELSSRPAGRYYLVAEEDGQIAGYAGLLAPEPGPGRPAPGAQADVLTMAVAPSRWGRGIGSALLEALLAEAARRGCAEVFLEVRVDNPRAQRLYRRHGFAGAGLRRGYYQPSGTDALVMRRTLDPAGFSAAGGPVPAAQPAPSPERRP
jgi:ribosomal-protein-alanine N-acetyltransferase